MDMWRQEQHILEELGRPHTWAGPRRQQHYESFPFPAPPAPPVHIYQSPPPAAPPATHLPPPPQAPPPPRIIQQTVRQYNIPHVL